MYTQEIPTGRPLWLLIAGPSGVGKTTLIEQMVASMQPQVQMVVTATTRAMRVGEKEGSPYYFMNDEIFNQRKEEGDFLETIERNEFRYGTLKSEIRNKLTSKRDLVMHIDWQGRRKIIEAAKENDWLNGAVISIFLKPENLDALRARLQKRGRNTPEEIEARLALAEEEIRHANEFDYSFVSTTYERDFSILKAIYTAEKVRSV